VLYLQDAPDQASAEEIAQAVKLQGEIFELAGSSSANSSEIAGSQLSFSLVGPMPLDLDFKQTLLGLKSEAERLQASFPTSRHPAEFTANDADSSKGRW